MIDTLNVDLDFEISTQFPTHYHRCYKTKQIPWTLSFNRNTVSVLNMFRKIPDKRVIFDMASLIMGDQTM